MIKDLDETIRKLILERAGFSAVDVEISFKQPTADWQAGLTRPAITCYLYNIQENLELRDTSSDDERNYQEGIVIRRGRPLRVDFTYFITAWTTEVEDEHEVIWRVLSVLANANPLPDNLLQGRLAEQPFPIPTRVAHQTEDLPSLTDVWSVMNNQFRPTVNYTITLALERPLETTIPLVFARRLRFHHIPEQEHEDLTQIGGIVYEESTRKPTANATVIHVDRGIRVDTDEFGRYSFRGLKDGKHRLQLMVNGIVADHEIIIGPLTDTHRFDLVHRL